MCRCIKGRKRDRQAKLSIALKVSVHRLNLVFYHSSALPQLKAEGVLDRSVFALSAFNFVTMKITQLLCKALPSSLRYAELVTFCGILEVSPRFPV